MLSPLFADSNAYSDDKCIEWCLDEEDNQKKPAVGVNVEPISLEVAARKHLE